MCPRYINDASLKAREEEILDRALEIISEQGITALTIDKLVSTVSYSKGTLYNHFSSKEDVLTALCSRNMRSVKDLFIRTIGLNISGRDKMIAISFAYMLSVLLLPQHFTLVMNAKTELFEKASDLRRQEREQLDQELFNMTMGVIKDAITNNELSLQANVDEQQVCFSIWAMAFGTIGLLLEGEKACSTMSGLILEDRVIAHSNLVMDGFHWNASERDQGELVQWLKKDVFLNELKHLEALGIHLCADK